MTSEVQEPPLQNQRNYTIKMESGIMNQRENVFHSKDGSWVRERKRRCNRERERTTEKRTQMKANWMRPKHKRMKISGKKRKNWNNKLMNHLKNKLRMKMNLLRYCCMGSNYRSWRNGISALTAIIFWRLLQIFPNKTKKKEKISFRKSYDFALIDWTENDVLSQIFPTISIFSLK